MGISNYPGNLRKNSGLIHLVLALALFILPLAGCGSPAILAEYSISPDTIRPNERPSDNPTYRKLGQQTDIHYRLTRRSDVTISIINNAGKIYQLRQKQTRQADSYDIDFRGAVVTDPAKETSKVLPDGQYTVRIDIYPAESPDGTKPETSQEATLTIQDANTIAPEITALSVENPVISPNGDGDKDDTRIGYSVSVSSTVTVRAVSKSDGKEYLLQEPKKQAGPNGFTFNGYELGGNLMPDGDYYVVVKAEDRSGNVSTDSANFTIARGGQPMLWIEKVTVDPPAVAYGGVVTITAVIKNIGNAPVKTQGPPSKTLFSTQQTFTNERATDANGKDIGKYYEKNGRWRLAVMWTNAGSRFPLRWGLTEGSDTFLNDQFTLQPDQEVTVTAPIKVEEATTDLYFTVAIEQGGVGFLQETVLPPIHVGQ